jgi:hypothetical protein
MTSTAPTSAPAPTAAPAPSPTSTPVDGALRLEVAGRLVAGLAARDFDRLVGTLADDVRFRALLPSRVLDLAGPAAVREVFVRWFGGAQRFRVVEAVVGEVGGRAHLRWRVRLTDTGVAEGPLLVEQQLYADVGADGRLRDVALLCTGYRPDAP